MHVFMNDTPLLTENWLTVWLAKTWLNTDRGKSSETVVQSVVQGFYRKADVLLRQLLTVLPILLQTNSVSHPSLSINACFNCTLCFRKGKRYVTLHTWRFFGTDIVPFCLVLSRSRVCTYVIIIAASAFCTVHFSHTV